MSERLWSLDQLTRFTRYEDSEVRYWAADRAISLFPAEAPDAIVDLVLDEHDATPEIVVEHLARHGAMRHVPMIIRGFRKGNGLLSGHCLDALQRLGYDGTAELAATALHQRDVPEASLAMMVAALARMDGEAPGGGRDRARDFLLRRPELFAEPAGLRGAALLWAPGDTADLIRKWLTAMHFRGLEPMDGCVRVLLEELQLEDLGWCVRTDRTGRIDIGRTFKAIESGHDIDLRDALPGAAREALRAAFGRGQFGEIARALGASIREGAGRLHGRAGDPLPQRLEALGGAFTDAEIVAIAEPLEPAMHQWLIGLLIAAMVKVSCYQNYQMAMEEAGDDLPGLLALAGVETGALLATLPARVAAAAGGSVSGPAAAVDWCLRTLEARGPFFPKAIALDVLGALRREDLIPEIARHLGDDSGYIYGAAERALVKFGPPVLPHLRGALEHGSAPPDAVASLVRVACDLSRQESLRIMLDHFDEIFETLGPEAASEAAAMVAHQDLMPPLRQWLDRSRALVGHTLLLVGALHNLAIPEEESILKAIDEYWESAHEGEGGPEGRYLM
jgi:hypothetical protein